MLTPFRLYSAELFPRIRLAHFSRSRSGLSLGWRTIPDFELVYFLEGEGIYQLLERQFIYKRGDLIITPPAIRHRYWSSGRPNSHYAVHFMFAGFSVPEDLSIAAEKISSTDIPLILDDLWDIPYFLPEVPAEFYTRFKILIELMDKTHVGRFAYRNIDICCEMLSLIGRVFSFSIGRIERAMPHFEKSRSYIENHLGLDIDVPDLAALEGVSPNYYSSRFRELYGLSPVAYINSRKMNRARRLLSETDLLIKEAARRCGFEDQYYFSRVFKKFFGTCPRSYRRGIKGR